MTERTPWPADTITRGTVINDQYRITGYLGGGGFGHVYVAEQRMMSRSVAIKVLTATRDRSARERFLREAQANAMIDHRNVITIHDFGFIEDERPFIVMELLQGQDLEKLLDARGPMPERRALELIIPCLDALQEAHSHKIVHKDLKPSNLFLTYPDSEREHLKVIDFGVAAVAPPPLAPEDAQRAQAEAQAENRSGHGRLTQVGQSLGTPRYMAPEYIERQDVSPAVDVYQMGLILVEMLTGKQVVSAQGFFACIVKHTSGDLDIPPQLRQGPLGQIIARATALDPAQRYQDAGQFRDALRQYHTSRYNPPRRFVAHLPARGDLVVELSAFFVCFVSLLVWFARELPGWLVTVWGLAWFFGAAISSIMFMFTRRTSAPWFFTRPIMAGGVSALTGLFFIAIGVNIALPDTVDRLEGKLSKYSYYRLEKRVETIDAELAELRDDLFEEVLKEHDELEGDRLRVRFSKALTGRLGSYDDLLDEQARVQKELEGRKRWDIWLWFFFGALAGLVSWLIKRSQIKAAIALTRESSQA